MSVATRKVAVVPHMLRDQPFGVRFREDLVAALVDHPEVELVVGDPEADPVVQVRLLQSFLAQRVSALIVAPLDPELVQAPLRAYREAGVPVIALDSDPGDPSLYRSLIMADNRQFGRKMGEFFAEVTGGSADLVEIRGMPTTSGARDRSAGFREAIAPYPGIRVVESLVGNWLYARSREAFAAALARLAHLDGVFAQNDEMARGAWDAASAVGRAEGLLITGIDALRGEHGLQLVIQGKLAATLINPPPGRAAAQALLAILGGEPVLKRTILQTSMFRSNERIRAWQVARRR
jgi:ABC-type sugar transport system substrate-binding protein